MKSHQHIGIYQELETIYHRIQDENYPIVDYETFRFDQSWQEVAERILEDDYERLLKSKKKRLGFFFEDLVEVLLQADGWLINHRNIQITDSSSTLGELDFLIAKSGRLIHLEVMVKFYLFHEGEWVGPGAKDTWSRKYQKSLDTLKLSHKYYPQYTSHAVCLQHRFEHFRECQGDWIWCKDDEIEELLSMEKESTVKKVKKKDWLNPLEEGEEIPVNQMIHSSIFQYKIGNKRLMIVKNNWPDYAVIGS